MLERVSRHIFFVFLILLPVQTVWLWREPMIDGAKWQYGTIGLYGTDILLLAALLAYAVPYLAQGGILASVAASGREAVLMTLFVCWSGVSLFWAEDRMLAGFFFDKLLLAYGAWRLVRTWGVSETRKAFPFVVIIAVAESLLGVGQFLSQSSFASTLLGMSAYESWQAGVSVLKNESGRWLRAYGTLPHPNIFGTYLGAMLVSVIGYAVWIAKRPLVPAAVSMTLLLGLLVSFSRSAWLGVALGLAALVATAAARGSEERRHRLVKIIGMAGIAAAVFAGVLHETVFPRFDGATVQKEASIVDRTALMRQSLEIIREHPLFGIGAGNYTLAVMRNHPEIPVWEVQPVHNVFLLVFAELGAIGLVLFLAFAGTVVWTGAKSVFLESRKENAIFCIALLSLVPSLLLDHFLWDSHFGLLLLFVLIGLSTGKTEQSST